jgi:hypothetical protein
MKMKRLSILLSVALLLTVFAALGHAAEVEDEREYRFVLGVVNKSDLTSFTVNERQKVYIVHDTRFYDDHGKQVKGGSGPKASGWVYVEGPLNPDGSVNAESLYVLRGPVTNKNRSRYPFIQIPQYRR